MTKVMWFSRHEMSYEQFTALKAKLGAIEVVQVNGTMPNVHVQFEAEITPHGEAPNTVQIESFKAIAAEFDILAVVCPINLQQQVLGIAGDRPVIFAKNNRVNREGEFYFEFAGWERLIEVKVVTESFA
jgi:hypothetical protein